ncbi:hypothetical protein [Sphingobium sp. Cam5-1]|uniref:hypothetical protein n=1 Tax=Sphingobium sp. Cam5-1 TaxID=2789327 RepID=UPI0018AD271B|nr:hypothetical protein [Sphingobium sp. Cam5-1]QPI73948.1 hypothetical protein IZV00_05645 [Sphingobium sp. Cam5-1]
MFSRETSLAIVGADLSTAKAASRRAEIAACRPGEPLELKRRSGTRGGRRVVAVSSPRGIEIGYISPRDADRVAGLISVTRAIFQGADTFGAVGRFTFDGSAPALPAPKPKPERRERPRPPIDEFCDIFPKRRSAVKAQELAALP